MKIHTIQFIIAILFCAGYTEQAAAQTNWKRVHTSAGGNLNSVITVSGWVQDNGYQFRYVCVGDSGEIFTSEDSGYTWAGTHFPGIETNLNDVTFPYPDSGLVVGDGQRLFRINRTAPFTYELDTSAALPQATLKNLRGISSTAYRPVFFTVGDSGTLLRSISMGRGGSWNYYNGFSVRMNRVRYVSNYAIYLACDSGTIIRGSVGGVFHSQTVPFSHQDVSYNDLSFYNDTGYAVATNGKIAFTTNGGTYWIDRPTGTSATLHGIDCDRGSSTANYAIAVGDSGIILTTTDYGATWTREQSGTDASLLSVTIPATGYAAVTGEGGIILTRVPGTPGQPGMDFSTPYLGFGNVIRGKTVTRSFAIANTGNAPLTITSVSCNAEGFSVPPLTGVVLPDSTIILPVTFVATGASFHSGYVVVQSDAGADGVKLNGSIIDSLGDTGWEWVSPQPRQDVFYDVTRQNQTTLIGVGHAGTVAISTDAGQTWTPRRYICGSDYDLSCVDFPVPDSGYIFGRNGAFLKSFDGGGTWESMVNGVGGDIVASAFDNPQTGCIVTFTSNPGYSRSSISSIFRTADAGSTWKACKVGRNTLFTSVAISPSGAIFAGGNRTTGTNNSYSPVIYRSKDDGLTWIVVPLAGTGSIYQFGFFDSLTGLAVGSDGEMYRTTDGGDYWTGVPTGITSGFHVVSILDSSTAIVSGNGGVILTSRDKGSTWSAFSAGVGRSYFAAEATGAGSVILTGSAGDINFGSIATSHDAGTSWTITGQDRTGQFLASVKFSDSLHGVAVGAGGAIIRSNDGGLTWKTLMSGTLLQFSGITFYDAAEPVSGTLIAVGENGMIVCSTDNGVTWSRQTSGMDGSLWNISFPDSNNGWITGSSGALRTKDRGAHWSYVQMMPYEYDESSAFTDSARGIVIGDIFYIYRTTDAGNHWDSFAPGGFLYDVAMHKDTGFVVGENVILGTTDGGKSWQDRSDGLRGQFNRVSMLDGMNAFVLGPNGIILRTTDDGQNWIRQASGTSVPLYDCAFINASTAIIVGDGGLVLRTTNGGGNIGTALAVNQGGKAYEYSLGLNYPNPFNPATSIKYEIAHPSLVTLKVYDILGREVAMLVNEYRQPGSYTAVWNTGGSLPSGVYFYRMTAGGFTAVKKMVLVK
jgi:photosystem II stability/assembly factor-like uncharacterized protein